jgi:hypothetical protein
MNRPTRGIRRTVATVAGTAVLLGAFLAAAGATAPAAWATVEPATAAAVAAGLGANNIPAALVILVDTSASMAPPGGLYPDVYKQLPKFLTALHKQDPEDQVSVVEFSDKSDTQVIYNWGPPQDFSPPPNPHFSVGTDIGYAFQLALSQFDSAPKNALIDDVLLLSDGGMWAPDDPTYDGGQGYSAPGWAKLRQRVQGLPVTGYGLPLASNPSLTSDLGQALTEGFGSQQAMLSSNYSDLAGEMVAAQQKIMDSRVATAAAHDSGRGVQVRWSGAGVVNGMVQLNLAAGKADPSLTLTATTSRVPLEVQDLHVSVSGFPEPINGTVGGDISLSAGQQVTVPLQLSWKPVNNSTQIWSGTITLTATVGSPYNDAIRGYYLDRSFRVGGLIGSVSAYYQASPPAPPNVLLIALIVLLVLLAAAALLALVAIRTRLSGTITFTPADGRGRTEALPKFRPWYTFDTRELGVQQGTILIRRTLITRDMRMTSSRHRKNTVTLRDNGTATIAGIRVQHDAGPQRELAGR